jgi:hypothetical protein
VRLDKAEGAQLEAPNSHQCSTISYNPQVMSLPTLSSGVTDLGLNEDIKETPFPAATKFAAGLVRGVETDVSSVYFVDKILITITQGGRLSQWVCSVSHAYPL